MTSARLLRAGQGDKHDGTQCVPLSSRAAFLEAAVVCFRSRVEVYFIRLSARSRYIWEGLGHLASGSSAAGGRAGLNLGDTEAFRAALPAFADESLDSLSVPPWEGEPRWQTDPL